MALEPVVTQSGLVVDDGDGTVSRASTAPLTPPTGTGFRHVTADAEDGTAKLVDTADINNSQVTYAKIQNVSADKVLGSVGGGAVSEIACTAAGRALIDDATAAAQRTTLGLGTAATSNTGDFAAASHTHVGTEVSIDDSGFSGSLAGAGVTNVQLLAEWIDANVIAGG